MRTPRIGDWSKSAKPFNETTLSTEHCLLSQELNQLVKSTTAPVLLENFRMLHDLVVYHSNVDLTDKEKTALYDLNAFIEIFDKQSNATNPEKE